MNLKKYIESGILELYALDLLNSSERARVQRIIAQYQELSEELERIYKALEADAVHHRVTPKSELRSLILNTIENKAKEKQMYSFDLPLIDRYSDYRNWLRFTSSFGEMTLGKDGKAVKILRNDSTVTQMLIVSTTDIDQEVHNDELESFLILSGECKCTIGSQVRLMGEGDFMAIPLYEQHDVQLISPKVTAILQRVKI